MRSSTTKSTNVNITTAKGTKINRVSETQIDSVKINPRGSFKSSTRSIFTIIIAIIIAFSLVRILSGGQPLSFSSLLEYLSNSPTVEMPYKFFNSLTITADWGLFNWFRDFVNLSSGVVGILVFLATGVINAIFFLTYFLRFIFI